MFLWHLAGWFIQTHILGRFWLTRSHRITVFRVLMVFCEDKPKKKEAEAGPPQSTAWWSPSFHRFHPWVIKQNYVNSPFLWQMISDFQFAEKLSQASPLNLFNKDGDGAGTWAERPMAAMAHPMANFHGERRKSGGRLGKKMEHVTWENREIRGVSHSVQRVGRLWLFHVRVPRLKIIPKMMSHDWWHMECQKMGYPLKIKQTWGTWGSFLQSQGIWENIPEFWGTKAISIVDSIPHSCSSLRPKQHFWPLSGREVNGSDCEGGLGFSWDHMGSMVRRVDSVGWRSRYAQGISG